MKEAIKPHGGTLINRRCKPEERPALLETAFDLRHVHLQRWEVCDLEMIGTGAFSPLEGFMGKGDYESVLEAKRLANGLPWSIPVTLSVRRELGERLEEGEDVSLLDHGGATLGILHLQEKYEHQKAREASQVYGTEERKHPGVDRLYRTGDILLGGRITVVTLPGHTDFSKYRLSPGETRRVFEEKGWRRIVAFQTRNPIHRAHEYIQKCALEIVDGLLLHPLVGETKRDDIPAEVRIRSYEAVLEKYYPKDRFIMAVLPMAMRYAGPREAILHAIVRKNYGCTHFIVGRDHAGVGNYYGPFDAHYAFDEFDQSELGIVPLFFDNAFFCRDCGDMASHKTCPHEESRHVSLSGTKVRRLMSEKKAPPVEVTRPEVAQVLIDWLSRSDYRI